MAKSFYNIIRCMLCAAVLLGSVSCGSTDDEDKGVVTNEAQVSFILSLSNATEGTRAGTWGDTYSSENGTVYENQIDPSSVQVLIYDSEGKAHEVIILSYTQIQETPGEYEFIGAVTDELPVGDKKLMVFANAGKVSDTSITSIGSLNYSYNSSAFSNQTQLIPMWGVGTYQFTLVKGERVTLEEPIYLLRAMAKVEIKLDAEFQQDYPRITIANAALSQHASQGYVLPEKYNDVANTKKLDQENCFRPFADASVGTPLDFILSEDKKTATLYIPEYRNTAGAAATISLMLSGDTESHELVFKEYADGQPIGNVHDIVRNHIYRYTVKKTATEFKIEYTVCPWLTYMITIPDFD